MEAPSSPQTDTELRCRCGCLLARVTPEGIELKCRRCKRTVLVATQGAADGWIMVPIHEE